MGVYLEEKREVREKEGEVEGGRASRQHDGNRGR